jgi:hypothetical protein
LCAAWLLLLLLMIILAPAGWSSQQSAANWYQPAVPATAAHPLPVAAKVQGLLALPPQLCCCMVRVLRCTQHAKGHPCCHCAPATSLCCSAADLFQVELLDTRLIRRDGGALDAHMVLLVKDGDSRGGHGRAQAQVSHRVASNAGRQTHPGDRLACVGLQQQSAWRSHRRADSYGSCCGSGCMVPHAGDAHCLHEVHAVIAPPPCAAAAPP